MPFRQVDTAATAKDVVVGGGLIASSYGLEIFELFTQGVNLALALGGLALLYVRLRLALKQLRQFDKE